MYVTYVCVYARAYVCMYVRMYARMYVCMYACTHVCVGVVYVCMTYHYVTSVYWFIITLSKINLSKLTSSCNAHNLKRYLYYICNNGCTSNTHTYTHTHIMNTRARKTCDHMARPVCWFVMLGFQVNTTLSSLLHK